MIRKSIKKGASFSQSSFRHGNCRILQQHRSSSKSDARNAPQSPRQKGDRALTRSQKTSKRREARPPPGSRRRNLQKHNLNISKKKSCTVKNKRNDSARARFHRTAYNQSHSNSTDTTFGNNHPHAREHYTSQSLQKRRNTQQQQQKKKEKIATAVLKLTLLPFQFW